MEEIEFSRWLFEGRPRQGKNVLPDGLNWLCYFAGNSIGHRENSISFIFLESPHQVERTNEFVLFAFLLFTANKSNSFVRFLGESAFKNNSPLVTIYSLAGLGSQQAVRCILICSTVNQFQPV